MLQGIVINLGDNQFIGIPFVMHSGGNWYKDNGSDYYVSVLPKEKAAFKVRKSSVLFSLIPSVMFMFVK